MDNRLYCESVTFGAKILTFCDFLDKDLGEFIISKHLLHSGLHIGVFIGEAFSVMCINRLLAIEKLNIALQFCAQTIYWLDILCASNCQADKELKKLSNECYGLKMMLSSLLMIYKNNERTSPL